MLMLRGIYKLAKLETLIPGDIRTSRAIVDQKRFRQDERKRRDSYVYVYLDPRVTLPAYYVTEDFSPTNPIVYIGRGIGERVLQHITGKGRKKKGTTDLTRWITRLRADGIDPIVAIYSHTMSCALSEDLEADLIAIVTRLQDPSTGNATYTAATQPLRLFNARNEYSEGYCYELDGKVRKWKAE